MMKTVAVLCGLAACAAALPVKLQTVTMRVVERDGKKYQEVSAEVVVKNIAYRKEVYLHFTNADGVERHLALGWSHMLEGNKYEVWKLATVSTRLFGGFGGEGGDGGDGEDGSGHQCRVAVDYKVSGKTFCDMDEGNGYFFDCNGGLAVGPEIVIDESVAPPMIGEGGEVLQPEPGTFAVRALVRDISPSKHVHIYYTTDNWETSESGAMTRVEEANAQGMERWVFLGALQSGSEVQYWVHYAAGKKGYTNNNYGKMFTTTIL